MSCCNGKNNLLVHINNITIVIHYLNIFLFSWVTFQIQPTTREQIAFKLAHSRPRMVVERAFGLVKSRVRLFAATFKIQSIFTVLQPVCYLYHLI